MGQDFIARERKFHLLQLRRETSSAFFLSCWAQVSPLYATRQCVFIQSVQPFDLGVLLLPTLFLFLDLLLCVSFSLSEPSVMDRLIALEKLMMSHQDKARLSMQKEVAESRKEIQVKMHNYIKAQVCSSQWLMETLRGETRNLATLLFLFSINHFVYQMSK